MAKEFKDVKSVILQNKDFDGGIAGNRSRMTLPSNSTDNLAALERKEATLAWDTDQQSVVVDDGSGFSPIGSGGSGDATSLQGIPISADAPSPNQFLEFDGSEWHPVDLNSAVDSVNDQTGVVILTATDVGAASTSLNNIASTSIPNNIPMRWLTTAAVARTIVSVDDSDHAFLGASQLQTNVHGDSIIISSGTTGLTLSSAGDTDFGTSSGRFTFTGDGSSHTPKLVISNIDQTGTISLSFAGTGTPNFILPGNGTDSQVLTWNSGGVLSWEDAGGGRFYNDAGDHFVGLQAPGDLSVNQIYVLPHLDGNAGDVLSTDSSGNLSFVPNGIAQSGNTASRPASPVIGQTYFDTDLNSGGGIPIWYSGTDWIDSTGNVV